MSKSGLDPLVEKAMKIALDDVNADALHPIDREKRMSLFPALIAEGCTWDVDEVDGWLDEHWPVPPDEDGMDHHNAIEVSAWAEMAAYQSSKTGLSSWAEGIIDLAREAQAEKLQTRPALSKLAGFLMTDSHGPTDQPEPPRWGKQAQRLTNSRRSTNPLRPSPTARSASRSDAYNAGRAAAAVTSLSARPSQPQALPGLGAASATAASLTPAAGALDRCARRVGQQN